MATITASAAGGKWSAKASWVGEVLPTAADDVILAATSGSIEIAAASECRSLDATNYTKTLSGSAEFKVGTTTSNAGLCFKWGAGTFTYSGTIKFLSTSGTVEKLTFPAAMNVNFWTFEGEAGKWELLESSTNVGEVTIAKGELITNNKNVECKTWWVTTPGKCAFGKSTITCTRTSATVFNMTGPITASEATIKTTGAGEEAREIAGGGNTFGTLIIETANTKIAGSNTFGTLTLNTAGFAKATTIVQATTQTITTALTTNAKAGSLVKLESSVAGKTWKLKAAITIELSYVALQDGTAEGGGTFTDRGVGGLDKGHNAGWLFDEDSLVGSHADLGAVSDLGSRF